MSYELEVNGELYHHGIKGQKWGVRRYQNADGTLTPRGRKRYGVDLDINDKTRKNVAKIRLGEARRRYDVAKNNNETNYTRLAELKGRERSAKRAVKEGKQIDKGMKLLAKGKTSRGEGKKVLVAAGAGYLATKGIEHLLNRSLRQLDAEGRLRQDHRNAAQFIYDSSAMLEMVSVAAYARKKQANQNAMRKARYYDRTLKSVGSEEYAAVVKRRKSKSE